MTETVVHVTTLEQWKSVLDVWFKQGYDWLSEDKDYGEELFETGGRFLFLDDYITYSVSNYNSKPYIEFSDFMAQQKEDKEVKTYYVTQEQLDLIEELRSKTFPIDFLILSSDGYFKPLTVKLTLEEAKALLRYLGGDETIEFKVKETLYRLWRIDSDSDRVYMRFSYGTPSYSSHKDRAFTAPLEEIKKHKTVSWEIEKAD
jgi:general stress protein 26